MFTTGIHTHMFLYGILCLKNWL